MHSLYSIVTGPLLLLSFLFFIFGFFYRILIFLFLVKKRESFILKYISIKHSIISISHWIFPFGSLNWRLNPVFCIITFVFHFCCLAIPIFLLSHVVILEEKFKISWWTLPDLISDFMTIFIVFSIIFFLIRRIFVEKVRFVTTISDYMLLFLIFIPFITGLISYHQWFYYDFFLIFHIISAEILLIFIPHTRLKHMFLFFLNRSYLGSEFGKIRKARDW